jgi:hypothetical protein
MATDRQLIRQALYDAIDWQAGLADAYAHIPNAPEREEALSQVSLYRGLLRRRYGEEKRKGEQMIDAAKSVSIDDLRQSREK